MAYKHGGISMTPSPYLLPEGNVQIAFSGGRTSRAEMRDFMDRQSDNFDQLTQLSILYQTNNGECT